MEGYGVDWKGKAAIRHEHMFKYVCAINDSNLGILLLEASVDAGLGHIRLKHREFRNTSWDFTVMNELLHGSTLEPPTICFHIKSQTLAGIVVFTD